MIVKLEFPNGGFKIFDHISNCTFQPSVLGSSEAWVETLVYDGPKLHHLKDGPFEIFAAYVMDEKGDTIAAYRPHEKKREGLQVGNVVVERKKIRGPAIAQESYDGR